jgi:hypothetical protein
VLAVDTPDWSTVLQESLMVVVTRLRESCEIPTTVSSGSFQIALSSLLQLFDADIPVVLSAALKRVIVIVTRPARLVECVEFDQALQHDGPHGVTPPTRGRLNSAYIHLPRYLVDQMTSRFGRESDGGGEAVESGEGEVSRAVTPNVTTPFACGPQFFDELTENQMPQRHDFDLTKLLSSGAFGSVYLAHHIRTKEQVGSSRDRLLHLALLVRFHFRSDLSRG